LNFIKLKLRHANDSALATRCPHPLAFITGQ
jgi:hypothetical protein